MRTYDNPAAFRAALEERLRTAARLGGRPVGPARKIVAFSRLLARLTAIAPDTWTLKGGFALELRIGSRARATRDIDLDWHDSIESATTGLIDATRLKLDDFFSFQVERASGTLPELGAAGIRFRATAFVAGRIFEELLIDVGVNTQVFTPREVLKAPDLLDFAGISAARIPTAPLEQHFADKLHAYTRPHPNNASSSRVKDLIDMALIGMLATFTAQKLNSVINNIFLRRRTHAVPASLPTPPTNWRRPYRRLALQVGLDENPLSGHTQVSRLINPVLSEQLSENSKWDPVSQMWGR